MILLIGGIQLKPNRLRLLDQSVRPQGVAARSATPNLTIFKSGGYGVWSLGAWCVMPG